MNQKIYLLFSCDVWKSKTSMFLVTATLSKEKLKAILENEIRNQTMQYRNTSEPADVQVQLFQEDWAENDMQNINAMLEFGDIVEMSDGEVR